MKITYSYDSMLNRYQWEATCHNNLRGNKPYAYFWNHEVAQDVPQLDVKDRAIALEDTVKEQAFRIAELERMLDEIKALQKFVDGASPTSKEK
jgi:hypothetical protein